MKVFVTGATGFVGREVVKQLHQAGHTLRALVRSVGFHQTFSSTQGFETHTGDILDPNSLKGSMAGIEAVIHLVGIISEAGEKTFENVHREGTRNVLRAAQESGVRRFVHMSALGTRANALARYHQTKWEAEELVRHSGLDFTIFRPSIIYGPQDHFVNLFAKLIRWSPILPVIGSGEGRMQPVPVEHVAKAFASSLTERRSVGETYDLCGSDVLTFNQLLDQIMDVMQKRRLRLHLPLGLARAQAACLEFIFPRLLGKAPPLNCDQIIMLQEDNTGNGQPARELFRLELPGFREGITKYLRRT